MTQQSHDTIRRHIFLCATPTKEPSVTTDGSGAVGGHEIEEYVIDDPFKVRSDS